MTVALAATETTAELRSQIVRHRKLAGQAADLLDADAQAWHLSWAEGGLPVYEERDRLQAEVVRLRAQCESCPQPTGSDGVP